MNITDEQGVKWLLQKAYEAGYRYIAMDKDGSVGLCKGQLKKGSSLWYSSFGTEYIAIKCLDELINSLVSWEDEEPFDIGKYLGIVDWANVPVDTKVLVSHNGGYWKKRYFKCYDKKGNKFKYTCFGGGRTSWSRDSLDDECSWKYCKLAEGE